MRLGLVSVLPTLRLSAKTSCDEVRETPRLRRVTRLNSRETIRTGTSTVPELLLQKKR